MSKAKMSWSMLSDRYFEGREAMTLICEVVRRTVGKRRDLEMLAAVDKYARKQ